MSSAPVRVALLNPCFFPEVRRGSERIVRELADGLIERGDSPRLITSHRARPTTEVEDGLPIRRNWRPPDGRLRRREFEDYLTQLPFSYLSLRRGDDEVAHAFYPTDALAAIRWGERSGRPAVLSWMGLATRRWLAGRRLRPRISLEALTRSDRVVVLSHAAADALRRTTGVEAGVIYPGLDLEAFAPGGERAEDPTIFCGAMPDQPQKRVGLLVEAFRLVRRDRPTARLVLPLPPAWTSPPPVEEGVVLRDLRDRTAVIAAYREAWISALPSWGEAFGMVLVESMACGTPVVGSDIGAIPEIVDSGDVGRLFAGESPRELAAALLDCLALAGDPATESACRTRAEDFPVSRTAGAYASLYRDLLARA